MDSMNRMRMQSSPRPASGRSVSPKSLANGDKSDSPRKLLDLAVFWMQQLQFHLHLRRMVESSLCWRMPFWKLPKWGRIINCSIVKTMHHDDDFHALSTNADFAAFAIPAGSFKDMDSKPDQVSTQRPRDVKADVVTCPICMEAWTF
ncbi:unnamed protein product [Sphagnum jensenii]|uniref:RING/U-box superfamily protein n=1 Tax=Sphagnum jensenii TaxID=128206 RepID=A0ABP1BD32_9BRYO